MSQDTIVLPTTGTVSGLTMTQDTNAALLALATLNSGTSAPATTYAYMLWADTTNSLLKQRDSTNTTWNVIGILDKSWSPANIQPITASVASNALTLTLNPTVLDFRSATLGSGTVNTRVISSAISLVISSGSTLGTVNASAARIAILAIDNAGTVELAAVNLAGGNNLDETTLISTTAEGGAGAADSASAIYSTAARSNVPFRVVGFIDITEATAGTWATAPTTIQGQGGQALAALSSAGFVAERNVTASRATGTTYYNTTGRPIVVSITLTSSATANAVLTINGVARIGSYGSVAGASLFVFGMVGPGESYSCTTNAGTPSIQSWLER